MTSIGAALGRIPYARGYDLVTGVGSIDGMNFSGSSRLDNLCH